MHGNAMNVREMAVVKVSDRAKQRACEALQRPEFRMIR